MPVGYGALRAILMAAAFTPSELERICQAALGVSLSGLTTDGDGTTQADALIAYAARYDLLRNLAATILDAAADRPGVQHLLLSDNMEQPQPQPQQNGNQQYAMWRIETKLDALSEKMNTIMLEHNEDRRRIAALEAARSGSPLNWQIIAVTLIFAVIAATATWAMAVR